VGRVLWEARMTAVGGSLPRVTLRVPAEAADALGVSPDYFDEHVRPELKLIRRGRLVLVSMRELERWASANEARTL
jgi:hypothetical protein